MLTSICLWSFVFSLNNTENARKSKTLIDVSSVALFNPVLGFTGLLAFFSLAGVPPLAGFFCKNGNFYLFHWFFIIFCKYHRNFV